MTSFTLRHLATFGRLAVLVASLAGLAGCLKIPDNQSSGLMSARGIPNHVAFAGMACVDCHEVDRPPPTIQAVTGIRMIHGGGRDCGECHIAGGPSWTAYIAFSHVPVPAACNDCHLTARPTTLINRMLHGYPGAGDCVACHVANVGTIWSGGVFHASQPVPGTCVECHAVNRPTTLVSGFSHEAGGSGDCAACHHDVGRSWAGGFFSHSPAPAKCSDCHAGDRPTGTVGPAPGFDHAAFHGAGLGDCKSCHQPLSSTQTDWRGGAYSHVPAPTSCIDCHKGDRPSGLVGSPAFDHANAGTGDCVLCHQPTLPAKPTDPGLWASGVFSHVPSPATCIGCHAADRPTVPVGNPAFDHSIAGMGDCRSCHTIAVANPGSNKALWTGGNFSHVPAPATCSNCHLAQRPIGLVGPAPGFNHALGGLGDCAACHKSPGVTWAGAVSSFDHSTLAPATRCDSCHEAKRPATGNTGVAGTDTGTSPFIPSWSNNEFLHSVMATTDCRNCHLQSVGTSWAGATFTGAGMRHTPNPGQCSVCHVNQRPPINQARGSPAFYHSRSGGGADSGLGLGDCGACHTSTSTWTGGNFSHISPSPTTCVNCHVSERPMGLVGTAPNQFDHAANNGVGLGDCVTCHTVTTAMPVASAWSTGLFNHISPTKPTLCASCHLAEKPTVLVSAGQALSTDGRAYTNDYLHSLVAGDCAGCHNVTTGQPDPGDPNRWRLGLGSGANAGKVIYSHVPAPATCAICHTVTTPTGPVGSSAFDHAGIGAADCSGCHQYPGQRWTGAVALPATVTLTPPTGTNWGNISAAHPVIDPVKNSGLTCASCHGTNTSATIIGYDHANPVAGSKCEYCHVTGQTESSATLTMQSQAHQGGISPTRDCSLCHSPSLPTWSATAGTFTGGSWSMQGIPDHAAFAGMPCTNCHEVDRPPPTIQAVTGIREIHGGGRDCGECHVAGGPGWTLLIAFSHTPLPSSCKDCHQSAQPTALINRMLHAYPAVGDCVACHATNAGINWSGGVFHASQPVPATCVECHAANRPTTLVNGFSHEAGGSGDCAACHHDVGRSWAGGFFSHAPAPAKCSDCHAGDRPTGTVGPAPGFDHAAFNGAGLGDCKSCHQPFSNTHTDWSGGTYSHVPRPTSCIDCHKGDRPTGPVGSPAFDHANAGTADCVLCHQPMLPAQPADPGLWAGGVFSHVPAPATCITCHVADRPTLPVGNPAFDHSIAGMGDCRSCHTIAVANPGSNKALWAGGSFSHVPAPAICMNCHLAQRPIGLVGPAPGFDHALGGLGECAACHKSPGVTWAGAVAGFDHSTLTPATRCDSCHEAKRPATGNTGVSGTDASGAAFQISWSNNEFLHSVMATTDCRNCHLQNVGTSWTGGSFTGNAANARHTPNPGQCSACHANQRPAQNQARGTPAFYHSRSGGGADSGLGLGDCGICHTSTSTWTGGSFSHINPSPTTCSNCHVSERPTGLVGTAPNQFDHAANNGVGLGDCVTCHTVTTATPVASAWSTGLFNHISPTKPTLCAGCHLAEKPTVLVSAGQAVSTDSRVYTSDYLHSLVSGDCAGCHNVTTAQPSPGDPNRWKIGFGTGVNADKILYSHVPAPTTCTTCHGVTMPTGLVGSPAFDHAGIGAANCSGCHQYPGQRWTGAMALPATVTLTPPTGTTWASISAVHPAINAANVGINCATCHGTNTSAKIIGYDHANPVAGSKCVYCHLTGQTETSAAVTTKSQSHESGPSPTRDCNGSGCHKPSLPKWSTTSKTFSGGGWDSP